MVSNARYEEMKGYFEKRLERARDDVELWRKKSDKYIDMALEAKKLETECEVYKAIIDRLMGSNRPSDNNFMFEGKLYIPIEYELTRTPEESDRLTVAFVRADENL